MKNFLKKWLGINEIKLDAEASMDYAIKIEKMVADSERLIIDFGYKGDTTIIVASQLGGGQVHVIHTSFDGLRDLQDFLESHFPGFREAKKLGRTNHSHLIWDGPPGSKEFLL